MLFPGIKIEPLGIDQFLFWDQFGTLFINFKLIFNHVFYVRHSVYFLLQDYPITDVHTILAKAKELQDHS